MASQTYLQLCQRLRRECSVGGTGPAAVTGQTGQLAKLVAWAADAYEEIQNRHATWRWLRSTWSVNTVAETDTYAATNCTDTLLSETVSRFSHWWPEDENGCPNVKCYPQSSGVGAEVWLAPLPWSDFRATYKIGTQTSGQPQHYTIDPQNNLVLGPKPSAVYVVSGEYQRSPQILAADADVPEMPAQFHNLIVFWAMEKYGADSVAQEVYARAVKEGGRMRRAIERNQLPKTRMGGPLA
jgi:hypothetical protein